MMTNEQRDAMFLEFLDLANKSQIQESEEETTKTIMTGLMLLQQTLLDVRRAADALERMASAQEQLINQLSSRTW